MDRRQLPPGGARRVRRVTAAPALAAKPPTTWDGLLQVKTDGSTWSISPCASLPGYTKVKLDPTEVSFEKNWRRDYNTQGVGISRDISEKDVQKAVTQGVAAVSDIFKEEFTKGGYRWSPRRAPTCCR